MRKVEDLKLFDFDEHGFAHTRLPGTFRMLGHYLRHRRFKPHSDFALSRGVVDCRGTLEPWNEDAEFLDALPRIMNYTMIDLPRLYSCWTLAKQVKGSDIVEIGCWRGGLGALMAKARPDVCVHLVDTFEGTSAVSDADPRYKAGAHGGASVGHVHSAMKAVGAGNYCAYQGEFPKTKPVAVGSLGLLVCNTGIYWPTLEAAKWGWPKLPIGGVFAVVEYGIAYGEGAALAFDTFFSGFAPALSHYNCNSLAFAVKRDHGSNGLVADVRNPLLDAGKA